jgi:hypothetical protein
MHKDWKDTDGTVASVEEFQTRGGSQYRVVFTYEVDGHWCGGTFTTTDAYQKGDTLPVLYDPANPDRNNLAERETIRHWIIGTVIGLAAIFLLYAIFAR